ncbi:hypothetical protein BAUCODRAFT_37937 [Baudoinia panamericana UAMH 10762]|uniref:Uncharacterized protein n=1 Tax=Baudoinia panamericana (strain UAMH 10762) TaxID=717646 RepID=M2N219_BAUPA|nr:uncharacterized protein BAUCODRAFT_37937 [Baudoinia panamericana UAMH 10762]EMC93009.1 hypothetical protein BAUCODRAFT_37937 [Baudoinia panamericana UAMH 10762]
MAHPLPPKPQGQPGTKLARNKHNSSSKPAPKVNAQRQNHHHDRDRARTWKAKHPGIKGIGDELTKAQYKELDKRYGFS